MDKSSIQPGIAWFTSRGWKPFPFQTSAWEAFLEERSGIVTAPTGFGKTYSLAIPAIIEAVANPGQKGLQVLWITPIRALAKEIQLSWQRAIEGLGSDWTVETRTGDTSSAKRASQAKNPPHVLITTPESIHVLLARKGYRKFYGSLKTVVCDEWHELIGSKRGVLVELALSRIKGITGGLRIWGISATIGNMDEALDVLLGDRTDAVLIRANEQKEISVVPVVPGDISSFPWAGHYGLVMYKEVLDIIMQGQSTIVFTNTRAMCERWYQKLLEAEPSLAGQIAMHHGSISRDIRDWVEDALYEGKLKAVVSTSSLDLGVDFRPVENVIQVGSPKGVARAMQRAGRSGHSPGALSTIYFVPTHALELIEGAALRKAIEDNLLESRMPFIRSFDVLVQYLVTLAVSDGFRPKEIFSEVKSTYCFKSMSEQEWQWALEFVVQGGASLDAYDEFKKVEIIDGVYKVTDRRIAQRHRMSIGTIVSSSSLNVKYMSGKRLGSIEEIFISSLNPGDNFWFAGRSLEFVRVKENSALVRKSSRKIGKVPSWAGGRMPLSTQLSQMLRAKIVEYHHDVIRDRELEGLKPLLDLQEKFSAVPKTGEFLMEMYESRDGHHLIMYPFEGRFVHQGMGAVLGYRIGKIEPISFTIAMNDYGFELLSDKPIPLEEALEQDLFATENLDDDIDRSVNSIELAKHKFHEISRVAGLVFQGFPGRQKKSRHLQASTNLMFEVFKDYDPANMLFQQAYDEAMYFHLEKLRIREAFARIREQDYLITNPDRFSPFALPVVVDSLRERISSEKLEDRLRKMKMSLLS